MLKIQGARMAAPLLLATLLAACSPDLNWREVHAGDGAYTVLMPAKPAAHSRRLELGSIQAEMTLRGAEVDGVSYVVGAAVLATPAEAQQALQSMQDGMLRNIGAGQHQAQTVSVDQHSMTEVRATGKTPAGQPVSLAARFATRGTRAYQAVVLGPSSKVNAEAVQTFLESFHPDPA
jgi:hypothetical protein